MSFGSVSVGTSKTLTVAIANTGTTTVTFSKESLDATGYVVSGFSLPASLAAGKTLTISVRFTPETVGTKAGYIQFTSNASNASLDYQLTGTGTAEGAELTPTPASADLGSVPLGATNSQVIQLKNTGSTTLSISGASWSGPINFTPCKFTYPLTLGAGKTASCTILFKPSSAGSYAGTLIFSSNATDKTLTIRVSGEGIAATRLLGATPTTLNFGEVAEGKSGTLAVVLKNTGNSSVVVSGITTTTSVLTTSGGVQGATIAAGQSATLDIQYLPIQTGVLSGKISVVSNASGSPTEITVTGTGVSGTTHEVLLDWQASISSGISGYNVYRATMPGGGYTKVNPSIVTSTSFTDPGVASGATYSYEVRAVSAQGEESAPSAAVSAVIP